MMPADLDPAALAELRRLHEAATPGEWARVGNNVAIPRDDGGLRLVVSGDQAVTKLGWRQVEVNAELIAALRNALAALLDLAERAAAIDPALLARLETRYAHPGVPACEKCGAMLVAVPPGHGTTIPGRTLCCCPIALVGGGWAAESAVKVHYVESLRYVAHGDDDVLALVRWARGLAGEGDGVT